MSTLIRLAPFRRAYLIRGVLVWAGLRAGMASVAVADPTMAVLDPSVVVEVLLVVLVGSIVVLDARRRSEDLFLGNLGVPLRAIGMLGLTPAELLELLIP